MSSRDGNDHQSVQDVHFLPKNYDTKRRSTLRRSVNSNPSMSGRPDHFHRLCLRQQIRAHFVRSYSQPSSIAQQDVLFVDRSDSKSEAESSVDTSLSEHCDPLTVVDEELVKSLEQEVKNEMNSAKTSQIMEMIGSTTSRTKENLALEVRLENVNYSVEVDESESKIATVYNRSFLYSLNKWLHRQIQGESKHEKETQTFSILDDISLYLEPGKNYLVLGPPSSGKSSLLKAISGRLRRGNKRESLSGKILYNGRGLGNGKLESKSKLYIENAIAYIDQLDIHAPRLTVEETIDFSFQCKTGGDPKYLEAQADFVAGSHEPGERAGFSVGLILATLGLTEVKDTYVGDSFVRGVSGGQRRRVTVGEMTANQLPVMCGDEVSTGLDGSSTFDMLEILTYSAKITNMTRIFALLQPSPDVVSLFDEVILLGEGKLIYAGPIDEVEQYFADLGYICPQFMDVADFLQTVSSEYGGKLYIAHGDLPTTPPTTQALANAFKTSKQGKAIHLRLREPPKYVWDVTDKTTSNALSGLTLSRQIQNKYANSFIRSCLLNFKRSLTLWLRDRRPILVGSVKNILMGVSVGGVFSNVDDEVSLLGALFQAGLFIMLGAMQSATTLVADRLIVYKQMDANFFSSWPYVLGRTLAGLPQAFLDILTFGTILFFMVGLGDDRDISSFAVFVGILFLFALTMNMQLAAFASFCSQSSLQVFGACTVLIFILTGGFIVAPSAIPRFLSFLYWLNPFAWAYRALVVNEFRGAKYEDADEILRRIGFTYGKNANPFGANWILYGFMYMSLYFTGCLVINAFGLAKTRKTGGTTPPDARAVKDHYTESASREENNQVQFPFKKVTISFQNVGYMVESSVEDKTLTLLHGVDGIFRSSRMCALMGASGAGKTTLMDVIALRKRVGTVTGDIRLNGWPQDPVTFRRCSAYVFQFDLQSPELTVRETVLFSARLRLGNGPGPVDHNIFDRFVDQVLTDIELNELSDSVVGSGDGIGLSFEQKKRLSIAVELAAAPSVLFLDEPTSGLDARAAFVVTSVLRKIADRGQTIVATIHQPSSAIFEMFDDLLLLQKGGTPIYHGPIGNSGSTVVSYFESLGAPEIEIGENPANWVFRAINADTMGDLALAYKSSESYAMLQEELDSLKQALVSDTKIQFDEEFAASRNRRRLLVLDRLRLIYWRSPAYNLSRITVSITIAFVLGSMFISKRHQSTYSEVEMRSRLSVVFLSFMISGILAILSVVPIMTKIRDMFYRHRDAGMYGSAEIGLALGGAEKMFILISATLFSVVFLVVSGMSGTFKNLVGFWGFFTFNFAIYSYAGQAFVCTVRSESTALILSSIFIGLNNFFSGLIVLPQLVNSGFFAIPYYITPGHYVFEGMVACLFWDQTKTVTADLGSDFNSYLIGLEVCVKDSPCNGTLKDFIVFFFDGNFTPGHILRNIIILGAVLTITRFLTYLALKYIRCA